MSFNTYNPTKEDLIANAPEGATHYLPENKEYFFAWMKEEGGFWLYKLPHDQDWHIHTSKDPREPKAIHENEEPNLTKQSSNQKENPTTIRERMLEIRKEREAGINEEQDLINKLASMGFKLIEDIDEKLEEVKEQHDLQDWRNWSAGDLVTFTSCTSGGFTEGRNYVVREIVESSFNQVRVVADDSGKFNGWSQKFFKFHSRPTK